MNLDWMDDARCAGMDTEYWFPAKGDPGGLGRRALKFCGECPVRSECLEFGMTEPFGIFGGTTENHRREIRGCKPNHQTRFSPCVSCHKPTTLWSVFSGHCFECYRTRGEAA